MNHYELLYIVGGKLAETEVKGISDTIDALIAKLGGTVTFTQYWERRKLAYPINHINFGHYVITEFDMLPTKLAELDRQVHLSLSEVVRHQVVRKETVGTPGTLPRTRDELDAVSTEEAGAAPATVAVEAVATEEATPEEKPKRKPAAKAEVKTEEATEAAPAPKAEEVAATSATEEKAAEEKPALKKKKEKVSFEELDKKLDEILGDLS